LIEYRQLDERYLDWLYSLVAPVTIRNPARSYWRLCEHLFKKSFRWFVPNDDNRIEDARELRYDFLDKFDIDDDNPTWMDLDISVLELFIALSRRTSFESGEAPEVWFGRFLDNLDLRKYTDAIYKQGRWEDVDMTIDNFVDRKYKPNGLGGLFPLKNPKEDQREVEIWYQMSAYLIENCNIV
jgi:hypothetical protein